MKRLLVLFWMFLTYSGFSQTEELESLMLDLTFQDNDTTKIDTSLKIIEIHYANEDYDRALNFIRRTEKKSEDLKYNEGLAEIIYYKALIYKKKDDYINASAQFNRSKNIFGKLKDTLSLAKVQNQLGVLEIERGNYKKGLTYALRGIDVLEKRDLKKDLVIAYHSLAEAYNKTNNIEKAISYYLKSITIEEDLDDTNALIESYSSLAHLYFKKKDYKRSIRYYESALNYVSSNDEDTKAIILPELGEAYLKSEDYKTAADYLIESIKLNRKLNNKPGILKSLNNLGALNLAKERYRIAEDQLTEAGSIGRAEDNKIELLKNYALMKTLDSTRGNFESAFAWQNQFYKIKNQLDEEKQQFSTLVFEEEEPTVDNTATNEDTVVDLINNQKADEAQKTLDKYKLIFYALLAAFAVVSIFFVLFYLKRNSRIKYTRELEAKNQKIELQNEAILEQSKHLENINKVKDKLFSIVSHDLKDSLTSTKGFIDLLKDGQLSQEEFHNLLPELSENANNASLLLFNLLNWSKSQMQSLKPKPSLFDTQEVFTEKVKLVEQKMQTKGIVLVDNTMRDFVYADRSMVEIIIQNLLANAVKFCKAGDSITISNTISNGKAILSVADSGVGITTENQQKLFGSSTFTTVGTGNEKGTGLGLSICRELVELNQGRIWVNSEINKGSTFFVELPKTRVEDPVNT